MVNQTVINLVSYAKYLFMKGCETLDRHGPLAEGLAILNFHDAAEMYLNAIADHVNAPLKDNEPFSSMIEKIEKAHGQPISNHQSLIRLNKARVSFKHHGLLPQIEDVKSFRRDLESFLYVTTTSILGLNYEEISLASLVKYHRVRMYLKDAEAALAKNEISESVSASARAFALVQNKMKSQINQYGREAPREDWIDDIYKELEEYRELLIFLLFGINLAEHRHFKRISPIAQILGNDEFKIIWKMNHEEVTREDALLCYRFILNIALTLQENAVEDHTILEYVKRQNKLYKVIKESPIIVHPRKAEQLRQTNVGEILMGHFKKYDKKEYYAILEEDDVAYIEKNAVELTQ